MSKKKIWALPVALVALLMLAAAVVFAQTATAPPTVGKQIEDQMVTVGELSTSTDAVATIALADVDGAPDDTDTGADDVDDDAAFRDRIDSDTPPDGDDADDVLAFTALTYDKAVATVGLDGGTADTAVVGVWWDALDGDNTDCTPKANALGFTAGVGGNAPATSAGGTDATGFCQEFSALGTENIEAADAATGGALVSNAFHWDMLTGPEMVAAAKSDGVANYSSYGKPFKSLDVSQRNAVNGFFTNGVLAKGLIGNLTLTNQGIDDTAPHGKAGTAKIAVKASDAAGRFLGNSVGQSFMVTAKLTSTGEITAFNNPGATPGDALTTLMSPEGSGNGITHYSLNDNDNMQIDDDGATGDDTVLTQVRMVPTEKNVLDIAVNTGTDLAPYVQRLDYSLVNGDSLPFQVGVKGDGISASGGNGEARITVKPGHTLQGGMTYNFKLVVSESGNEAMHTVSTDIRVVTVVVNEGPMFNTAMLDAMLKNADGSPKMVVRERASGQATRTDLDADWLPMEFDFAPYVKSSGNRAMTFVFSGQLAVGMKQDADNPTKLVNNLMAAVAYKSPYKADGTMKDTNPNLKMVTITANDGAEMASYKFPVLIESNEPMLKADAVINTMVDGAMVFNRQADATTEPPTPAKKFVNLTVGERKTDEDDVETCTGCLRDDRQTQTVFDLGKLFKSSANAMDEWTYAIDADDAANTPLDVNGDKLVLRFVPNERESNTLSYSDIQVTVKDKFGDTVDVTANLNVTIEINVIKEGREHVDATVPEDAPDGYEIVDLMGRIMGVASYNVEGGSGEKLFKIGDAADDDPSNDSKVYFIVPKDENGDPEMEGHPLDVDAGQNDTYLLSVGVMDAEENDRGEISVLIRIQAKNEAPIFDMGTATVPASYDRDLPETAQVGTNVGAPVVVTDPEAEDSVTFSIEKVIDKSNKEVSSPFSIETAKVGRSYSGQIKVTGAIDLAKSPYTLTVRATDDDSTGNGSSPMFTEQVVTIKLGDINDPPMFDNAPGQDTPTLHMTISEGARAGTLVAVYNATDPDAPTNDVIEGLNFVLRNADDTGNFEIKNDIVNGEIVGTLRVADTANLEYDIKQDSPAPVTYTVEVNVFDAEGKSDEIALIVTLDNVNDETPIIGNKDGTQDVPENSPRGTSLGDYGATDKDNLNEPGFDTITYTLEGANAKEFQISDTGHLMTLASLDYDRPMPCRTCQVTVVATDSSGKNVKRPVTISVTPVEDSVSTQKVSKANPVPGTGMGDPASAFFGTKTTMPGQTGVVERPGNMPATIDPAPNPMNFVETDWGNWGTVLRIEIVAESPGADCGNGNQCVTVDVVSDSADDALQLAAYRSATQENKFIAAVMLVATSEEASQYALDSDGDEVKKPIYRHQRLENGAIVEYASVPKLRVDEEDEVEIKFGNLRADVQVENEMPEVDNFSPDHETAFDNEDVEYTFTITDEQSGLPEPEDLPDTDGDDEYMPVVALVSEKQCHVSSTGAPKDDKGNVIAEEAAHIHGDDYLYCPGPKRDGEYIAGTGGFGFAPIRDDKDFDSVDNGYDVDTTIVLTKNEIYFVTFIVCDNAGNCAYYDPVSSEDNEELAEVTVDTEDPEFVEARTGVTWDSGDNEYDDDKRFIQVIFNDLTSLNVDTVEPDDFVVEGHTITDVHVFENPDDEDVDWEATRFSDSENPDNNNKRGIARYRDLENAVFLELEDDLLADETPDVAVVPNGVEDAAGNEQDDGENEAKDWIAPSFTIVSMVSTLETAQDEVLAGEDDEVTVRVTADERLDDTRPKVTVTYVHAPAGSVDTKGTASCNKDGSNDGTRSRGEIVHNDDCADSGAATGGSLSSTIEKITNTEWVITINDPDDTGYYNFHIAGTDRSSQKNPGSEGVHHDNIVSDFFDADGDVNVEDAYFFEGDLNLPKPMVRVSGVNVTDNEADVEFRSPLFVELDFTRDHSDNCRNKGDDFIDANCENENSEYAEDNFDDIVVTSFVLDGVDLTDSVKTTDDQTFLVSLESVAFGDHTAEVQAMDQAGNIFEDTLEIDFEVNERDPFEKRLNPGWNLVSLPGEPADSSIASVLDASVEVRTVYTYNPVVPGGWLVAVRETLDSEWQGDLTEITGQRGYWILSDAIQDWEVSIPRLAGGAVGAGTPIQPPVIALYAGWNLIPVTDVKGNALDAGTALDAAVYLQSLEDGIEAARVLGFDTIRNEWYTVLDGDMMSPGMGTNLLIGSGYWVFVRNATALVPGGVPGVGSSD